MRFEIVIWVMVVVEVMVSCEVLGLGYSVSVTNCFETAFIDSCEQLEKLSFVVGLHQ